MTNVFSSCAPLHVSPYVQIDGFRFDIMGHMLVSTLLKMRSRLDELTIERDGVDGRWVRWRGERRRDCLSS